MRQLCGWGSIALLVGCTAFAPDDTPPTGDRDAGATDGAPHDGGAGSSADAQADAACVQQTPPTSIICNGSPCKRGDYCCLFDMQCFEPKRGCDGTQVNCTSKQDCNLNEVCCSAGDAAGTRCMEACPAGRLVPCRSRDDCGADEICAPPEDERKQPWWSCKPCRP